MKLKPLVATLALIGLSACAEMPMHSQSSTQRQAANVGLANKPHYRLAIADVVDISVWHNKRLSEIVPVRPDGRVSMPLIGAVDARGLDPQVGFLHRPRSGRPSLALDLLEELRPSVADRFSITCLARRQVRSEHFEAVGPGCYLSDEGRSTVLALYEEHKSVEVEHRVLGRPIGRWMLPQVQATLMARYLRGDLPAYPPFIQAS